MGQKKYAYRILVGKAEGKTPLGRRRRWVDNIKMDLSVIGRGDAALMDLDRYRE
jgi:hypothetical protein